MREPTNEFSLCATLVFALLTVLSASKVSAEQTLRTLFGDLKIDGAFEKIYNLPRIRRLSELEQLGNAGRLLGVNGFARIEQSKNVLFLLKRFGASTQEQIAGLAHNIAEVVFAQTADVVFGKKDYVKSTYEARLKESGIDEYLKRYDLEAKDVLPNDPAFKRLYRPSPEACAVNMAFYLKVGVNFKIIKPKDVKIIIANLRYDERENRWFFVKKAAAKKLATIPVIFARKFRCANDTAVTRHITGLILKRALELKRIDKDDLSFKTDAEILAAIAACDDPKLKKLTAKAKFVHRAYRVLSKDEHSPDFIPREKFDGIDPWVYNRHDNSYKRLSELDKTFAEEYDKAKKFCEKGSRIQLLGLD